MTKERDDRQQLDLHQWRRQIQMMPNQRQTTRRHVDTRRQPPNNSDRKPKTKNRYDALAVELIEDDIFFISLEQLMTRRLPISDQHVLQTRQTRRQQTPLVFIQKLLNRF